ncbi:MAG TPA: MliC family protein [Sphingomonas sp.]|nr:MliC family protein [Sphingomonas sp.]
MMRTLRTPLAAMLPLALVLAGCGRAPSSAANTGTVDINGTAAEAQGDIDTYASNALQTPGEAATSAPLPPPEPAASAPLNPPGPGEPGGLPDDRTPVSEAPFTPDSAQGAANVVQTYFALIEAGKYRQAWRLWRDGGKASGMSAAAFAASFAKYSDYHANIGAPGRIDAGAGQRYVTVPVQVYGRLKQGGAAFNERGEVTLHRTADIEGATAEDKTWHITAIDLKAKPGETEAPPLESSGDVPATAAADYRCADGSAFHIDFDNRANTGTVSVHGDTVAVLDAQRAGSGIWYEGGGYTLRGKGRQADFTRPGKPAVSCTAG